jgi:GH24 family phage-related lysozyme (muramidase)
LEQSGVVNVLISGDFRSIPMDMSTINHAGEDYSHGLAKRRRDEIWLFGNGDYYWEDNYYRDLP